MLTDDTLTGWLAGLCAIRRCATLADALDGVPVRALARLTPNGRMTWREYRATLERLRALWAANHHA